MKRALVGLLLCAAPAQAWESVCFDSPDKLATPAALLAVQNPKPCSPSAGPSTARNRWVGPLDEHRQLFEAARVRAGLPDAVSATQVLTVYTSSSTVPIGMTNAPTLLPVPFEEATRMQKRGFTPGELAQLPDFSFSLWDWASGLETCPLDSTLDDAVACHDFASHMGPVNSNHFLPQARQYYVHYHSLALARAQACHAVAGQLAPAQGRFDDVVKACEIEALTLEAVGQHYLQDAWSMGHMWQRWGSATLDDFPGDPVEKRDRAVLVALVAGLFHGARGVLQVLPGWTSFDVNDAMCAPWDSVRFVTADGTMVNGLGDDYLAAMPPNAVDERYFFQSRELFDCATSSLLEVYRASGENHGAAQPPMGLRSVDPRSDECFGQRATNEALMTGAAVNLKVAGQQTTLPVDARFVSWMLPKVARAQGKVPVSVRLRNEFRVSLQRVVSVGRIVAKDNPTGTELADGRMGDLLGVHPNASYPALAPYVEPPLPWVGEGTTVESTRAGYLERTFHRAHAAELCTAYDGARLQTLVAHARDTTLPLLDRAWACVACEEIVVRHLRVGTDAASYDTSQEPLCHYLVANPALVYHQVPGVTDVPAIAQNFCCP